VLVVGFCPRLQGSWEGSGAGGVEARVGRSNDENPSNNFNFLPIRRRWLEHADNPISFLTLTTVPSFAPSLPPLRLLLSCRRGQSLLRVALCLSSIVTIRFVTNHPDVAALSEKSSLLEQRLTGEPVRSCDL